MLSKNKIKLIKSLTEKKNRQLEGLFLVEGDKLVKEVLNSEFKIQTLIAVSDFAEKNVRSGQYETIIVSQDELDMASLLKTPQRSLALVCIPEVAHTISLKNKTVLCLDDLQDPGNLGTIMRLADWFGIDQIVCSQNTVDIFNPKAVQASMGAICRVRTSYFNLDQFFQQVKSENISIIGTFPEGKNIYLTDLPSEAVIVLGNEGNGINPVYDRFFDEKISIPNFSSSALRSESLNVSIAAAIICSEFKRRTLQKAPYSK